MPHRPRKILDKETVDEMIFNAGNARDRLILELQVRCGLRIGEVLKLKAADLSSRKLVIEDPKSGRDAEVAFMPEHISARLLEYVADCGRQTTFPRRQDIALCYTTVRNLVTQLGKKLNVKISPHDLRRHSTTYASRNGVPLEITSKVILRHQDLKTTQIRPLDCITEIVIITHWLERRAINKWSLFKKMLQYCWKILFDNKLEDAMKRFVELLLLPMIHICRIHLTLSGGIQTSIFPLCLAKEE